MEKLVTSNLKLGIIAGGQLGKMLIQEASKWNVETYVLDRDPDCPASKLAAEFTRGDYLNFDTVYNFGIALDVITYEIENINTAALKALSDAGVRILPDPEILEMIQDKGLQKEFYQKHQIPTSGFNLFSDTNTIKEAVERKSLKLPFVQKLRKGGYDGRGVLAINNTADLEKLLQGPSLVEEQVAIDKEIAVIVARNEGGDIRCFPIVEMAFNPVANLVEMLICPASVAKPVTEEAYRIANEVVTAMNYVGILAIEFFIDKEGRVLVNEVAPRPHNSGHHTIESVITSQYEQHLRAIFNLPLGSTQLKMPAVMINLLGEPGYEGLVSYEGLTESMAIEGVKIHLYGKKETRPMRKMGHATIMAPTIEAAVSKAESLKKIIKVKSWK